MGFDVGDILHNWFGYLSCFGITDPDKLRRDYDDCKPKGWQPGKDDKDKACTEPCEETWDEPVMTVTEARRAPSLTKPQVPELTMVTIRKGLN